ncbi:HD domain-containing protein [Salimicrobium flavidum]|uniref:HD/PDEase domain-containing protein n=1 Tax=Salimicrobium flavidum TaxID=570947 RepID=A0A1N7IJK7_9BACI|nr:HD domain-containing protein [Salimicrobium flavidum]SIS37248.1 uncharacterized protein SAMN05421687_101279 [Salimicrobium flavidum]
MSLSKQTRKCVEDFVHTYHGEDHSGHGTDHIERVVRNAVFIAQREGADSVTVELAAWFHDIDDEKLVRDPGAARKKRKEFLCELGFSDATITTIEKIIASVSFSKGGKVVSLEQQVVQDADRLDAIGAIGIARCFSYGAVHEQSIEKSIEHFHEKLLRIYDKLSTPTARREAENRHELMQTYIRQFKEEQSFAGGMNDE